MSRLTKSSAHALIALARSSSPRVCEKIVTPKRKGIMHEVSKDRLDQIADFRSQIIWYDCEDSLFAKDFIIEHDVLIPTEIRGPVHPSSFNINFGPSSAEMWDFTADQPVDLGLVFVGVDLFGYGYPNDIAKYQEMVFQLPSLCVFEKELKVLFGQVIRYCSICI